MSPFSWQCQNLSLLSLAFITDWRVVPGFSFFVVLRDLRKYYLLCNIKAERVNALLRTLVGQIFHQNCLKVQHFWGLPAAFIHHQGKFKYSLRVISYQLCLGNFQIQFYGLYFMKHFQQLSELKIYLKVVWKSSKQATQLDLWLNLYFAWWCSTSIYNMKASRWWQSVNLPPCGWIYIRRRYWFD